MNNFNTYLKEASFAKTIRLLRGDVPHVNTMALLTAQNPMGRKTPTVVNQKRNKALLRELKLSNFNPLTVGNAFVRQLNAIQLKGKFFGNVEDSFLIPHITREAAIYLARKHEQLAVIWGEKHNDPETGDFIHFQWIEASDPNDIRQPYITTQTRDIVIVGPEASSRQDNYTALKLPSSGEISGTHKVVIPFFDPRYTNAKYGKDKKDINFGAERADDLDYRAAEGFYIPFFDDVMAGLMPDVKISEDLFFSKKELPDTPEVQQVVESIENRVKFLNERLSGKTYWATLGSLHEELRQLKALI